MRATRESDPLQEFSTKGPFPRRRRASIGVVLALLALIAFIAALWAPRGAEPASAWTLLGMTPQGRFDALFERAMTASQARDSVAVTQLASAALVSFKRVKHPDADRRFHAAMLALHLRDNATAEALADSILAARPRHLLGLMIRLRLAEQTGDATQLNRSLGALLEGHRTELSAGLPEYRDHRAAIDRLLDEFGTETVPHGAGTPH